MEKKHQSIIDLSGTSERLFFGESGHGISRYDEVRYPIFTKLNVKMQSFAWRPNQVDMSGEKASFSKLTPSEQFVFTSNLKRQIVLDSVQGRAPALCFLPHCTDPSLENCILTWGFFESIHSESYTHVIRSIYPNPKEIFDDLPNIVPIVDCAHDVTAAYDRVIKTPNKENLYMALIAANALESIRFYVSFACTFSFLERGLMEGSAKLVKMIARDETEHMALVQHILKILPKDDPEFAIIAKDNAGAARKIFESAAEQEKSWASYLFKDGPILGLNEQILCDYVDYLVSRRLHAAKIIEKPENRIEHSIPWIEKHLSSSRNQLAPQEVELSSYLTASLENDINEMDFAALLN